MSPELRISSMPAISAVLFMLTLLMLPNLIWYAYQPGLQTAVEALIVPALLLLTVFALLGDLLWLACLLLAPFVMIAPMEAYYVAIYRHPTSAEIIGTLVASNPRETREYLGTALIPISSSLFAAMALALLTAWWSARTRLRWHGRTRKLICVLLIAIPFTSVAVAVITNQGNMQLRMQNAVGLTSTFTDSVEAGYPFGLLQRVSAYRSEWAAMRTNAALLDAFRFHAHRISEVHQRQVYVMVIGESSRRDHWQLFGYSRQTNPKLSRESNLVPIGDLLTSWPESLQAIPLILTRKPITLASPTFDEASILRAMREAGYETYWISNQMAIGKFDSPVSNYAYEAEHVQWLNHASWTAPGSYDDDLLQPLSDALTDSRNDLFVVLHMMGSHTNYNYRYPPSFKYFQPTTTDGNSYSSNITRQQNSYDNTILYTDHVLASIINILRKSGAITAMWYESDHGEMLRTATCQLDGHGLGTRFEFEIPAIFWYSDAYARQFPERISELAGNSSAKALSADTFESLIDMAGVDFPGHDESRSLFSTQWHFRKRIVNSSWKVDFDRADFGKNCPFVFPRASTASSVQNIPPLKKFDSMPIFKY